MNIAAKFKNIARGLKQRWGTASMKRELWNREYAEGRWDSIDDTSGDPVYPFIEKYCHGGSLLDLGCGKGSTGCELASPAYAFYTGVDIADVALQQAGQRSAALGRSTKNRFVQSDIALYEPDRKYDVILFRESIYYIPKARVPSVLERYKSHLTPRGVFIIRWHSVSEGEPALQDLCRSRTLLERHAPASAPGPLIAVLR
ncbi:MAG: class I SAM-dependent methyltransferase [Verrucomicrobiota bacterium]